MTSASSRLVVLWASLALFLCAACGLGGGNPAATPTLPPTQSPAPTATPEPSPTPEPEDLGPGAVGLIRRGWERILAYHISEPEPGPLLQAAWTEVSARARALGLTATAAPPLAGTAEEMWAQFSDAYLSLLERVPEAEWDALRFATIAAMTRSLEDCHTFYLQPARAEALTDVRTGRGSGGVGIELAPVRPAYVRETITGSPAQVAGILPGDVLVTVDGRDVTGMGIEAVMDLLRGDPGSEVALVVRRPPAGQLVSFGLTRALVRPPAAEGRVLGDGVGYIRIRSFTTGGTVLRAVDQAVAGFEAAGVTAWVLDLRDNPGGDSDQELAGRFIGEGFAERTLLRGGELELKPTEGDRVYPPRPLAVLVNGGTASVSEIFAGMLQDYGRARVFGSNTNRCAGFVALEHFPDGSTLGVTIAHSLTPVSEQPLWQTGVIPDERIAQTQADIAAGRDPVLDAAVRWLLAQ